MLTPQNLWKKLKTLREENWYSQEQVSEMLGIKRPIVAQIEAWDRKVKPEELVKYSEILDISIDSILKSTKFTDVKNENFDKKKFENLVLYILTRCWAKPNLWKIVLYKLLYFCDFNYFEKSWKYLTWISYIKLPMWPAPYHFDSIIDEMKDCGKIIWIMAKYYWRYQLRLIPNIKFEDSAFSVEEKITIDEVIKELSDMNASEISEYSHWDAPRKNTEDMQIIDYNYVKSRTPEYSILEQEKKFRENVSMLTSTKAFDFLLDEPDLYNEYKYL